MKINIIVAMDRNGMIGIDSGLPWRIPEDLQRFRAITMGSAVIMGRKTFNSLPCKHLSGRKSIVVTSLSSVAKFSDGIATRGTLDDAIRLAKILEFPDAFICGGASIYNEAMLIADKIYVTVIDREIEPNETSVYFNLDLSGFTKISESPRKTHSFNIYERTC